MSRTATRTSEHSETEIQTYAFTELTGNSANHQVKEFTMQDLSKTTTPKAKIPQEVIRKEREFASQSNFKISSMVKQHRGIVKQEEEDYIGRIESEVQKRLADLQEKAINEGYEAGLTQGKEEAYNEAIVQYESKMQVLESYIEELKTHQVEIFKHQKEDMYKMIKLLTKWVILKEVKNDQYMKDLFEKLILELQTKSNLLIKVNATHFEKMPEVIEMAQTRLGKLTNVRLEVEPDMNNPGIIIESENGIIDGSLEAQFINLDKLFVSVGIDEGNN